MKFSELKPVEQLAVAQAVYKTVASIVSTKDADSLRAQCDEDTIANYMSTGAKSYDVRVLGEKVGTYSVRVNKAKKVSTIAVEDAAAYYDWCAEMGYLVTDDKRAQQWFEQTGELPDGCTVIVDEQPERVAGTTLKVDERKVAAAMGGELPTAVRGLLEGEVA